MTTVVSGLPHARRSALPLHRHDDGRASRRLRRPERLPASCLRFEMSGAARTARGGPLASKVKGCVGSMLRRCRAPRTSGWARAWRWWDQTVDQGGDPERRGWRCGAVSAPSGTEGNGSWEKIADARERPAPVNRRVFPDPKLRCRERAIRDQSCNALPRKRMPGAASLRGLSGEG